MRQETLSDFINNSSQDEQASSIHKAEPQLHYLNQGNQKDASFEWAQPPEIRVGTEGDEDEQDSFIRQGFQTMHAHNSKSKQSDTLKKKNGKSKSMSMTYRNASQYSFAKKKGRHQQQHQRKKSEDSSTRSASQLVQQQNKSQEQMHNDSFGPSDQYNTNQGNKVKQRKSYTIQQQYRTNNAHGENYDAAPYWVYNNRKNLAEKLCGCFIKNFDITDEETKFMKQDSIKKQLKVSQKELTDLYLMVFGQENQKLPKRLESKRWREIGFQSRNPRAELRGGGILSLYCLRFFIKRNPEVFQQMLEDGSQYFYIALSSVNITTFLIGFFYLNKELLSPTFMRRRANKQEFKNFCRINLNHKKTFFELHCYCLRFLYMLWCREALKNQDQYPTFNLIMDETRVFLSRLMRNDHSKDLIELRVHAYNIIESYIKNKGFK
eukprot:403359427